MNKCPQCGAILKTLTRICEACGSEIPAEASATAQSASVSSPLLSAADVSAIIQDNLALLAARPPASRLAAFLTGLITLPTLGLGYLAVKAVNIFGNPGKSPERAKLALEQNLRVAENSYKADPDVHALTDKGFKELSGYLRRQHSSRLAFLAGIIASIVLVVVITGGVILHQKYQTEKVVQTALVAQLTADANRAALKLQEERDLEKQHEEAMAAAQKQHEEAVVVAQEIHKKTTNMANSMGADVSYKAAILVENRAGNDMADKVSVLEDLLNSQIAGKGFSVLSRAAVERAEAAISKTGAQSETVVMADRQLGTVAQDIGADFIIYASISSFGNEKKTFTGYGVVTDNYVYTLRVAYRMIEAGESGAIMGATVVASKTIRQTAGSQTDSTELINELLNDVAGQVVAAIRKPLLNPKVETGN
jgi:hypothetical protein